MFFIKNIIKIILGIGALFAIYFALSILAAITFDYNPENLIELDINGSSEELAPIGEIIDITTFNIGYCGLEKEQDFFMDGGKNSRGGSKEKVQENLHAIVTKLNEISPDLVMLQEVDKKGHRSFDVNQVEYIEENLLSNTSYAYGVNYDVKWVPLPITKPMGGALSGLMTISKYKVDKATRLSLPSSQDIPKKFFDLDRCLMETEIAVDNGKKLYLVNVHLSAFDKGGSVRKKQMDFVMDYLNEKRKNGDYIIMGGDWNHILNDKLNANYDVLPSWIVEIPESFYVEGFKMYSPDIATVRDNEKAYEKGVTFESIIDGFYVSDNVEVKSIKGYELGFENSDHNPVSIEVILK